MRFLPIYFVILLSMAACTESRDKPPYALYRGDFDPKNIACAEETIRTIARKWDFRIEEKDRREMKVANEGVDAFFIFTMVKKQDPSDIRTWVMTIGSFSKGKILSLKIGDTKFLTNTQKDRLAQEVIQQLETNCNTQLERYTEPYAREQNHKE